MINVFETYFNSLYLHWNALMQKYGLFQTTNDNIKGKGVKNRVYKLYLGGGGENHYKKFAY